MSEVGSKGRVRGATRAAALLATVVLFASLPDSARGDSTTAVAGGVVTAIGISMVCAAMAWMPNQESDDKPFARRGWLLGASGSYAIPTGADDWQTEFRKKAVPIASLSVDDSLGMSGRAGYRCHERLAAEVEVEWIDGPEVRANDPVLGSSTRDVQAITVTANAKGYLLTGRYQPFLRVGAGGMMGAQLKSGSGGMTWTDVSDLVVRMGAGVDVYASEHIVVNVGADYVLPFATLDNLDYVSIGWGLEYRF